MRDLIAAILVPLWASSTASTSIERVHDVPDVEIRSEPTTSSQEREPRLGAGVHECETHVASSRMECYLCAVKLGIEYSTRTSTFEVVEYSDCPK